MANYEYMLVCPKCGVRDVNLLNYLSLMVIKKDLGLFTVECPNCSEKVSSLQAIPTELEQEVKDIAVEIDANGVFDK